jgi:hypothetical protein
MKKLFIAPAFAAALFAQEPTAGKRVLIQQTEDIHEVSGVTTATRRFVLNNGPQVMEFVSGENVGPTVTKAPYAAETVTESIQTLYDGNRIVQRTSTKQFRDSEGRERREEGAPFNAVFITDPVAKVSYTLHPEEKTAEKMGGVGPAGLAMAQRSTEFASFEGAVRLAAPPTGLAFPPANTLFRVASTRTSAPKEEDLGTRMIEGVEAKGSRTTTTIAAGEIGNDRAIDIIDERWYSPELQLTVLTRHADPRIGENTYKLIKIQHLEQVRSLFEIPPGYTIHEGRVFTKPVPVKEE